MTATGVRDATGRIDLRRRQGRRRRGLLTLLVAGVIALIGGLAWLVLGSDVLGVKAVEVQGSTLVSADRVRELAAVPAGVPLATLDLDAVAARVAGLPSVERVSVARQWPNTVGITITERTALIAVETPGGYWLADASGVVFDSATKPPKGLVAARVASGDQRLIRDLGTVTGALPAALRAKVQQAAAQSADDITLTLSGGATVVWGGAEQSELKAQVLAVLMKTEARVYDVSAPSHPTTR